MKLFPFYTALFILSLDSLVDPKETVIQTASLPDNSDS